MELREIYETLLRRGMPEHPRLAHVYDGCASIWILTGDSSEQLELATFGDDNETDARDLITMHALRNLDKIIYKARIAQRWQGGWNMLLDEDYWSGRGPTEFTFRGDTILDAVMLAVAATEPKKTLA